MKELTGKQQRVLQFIEKYVEAENQSPTYKEIQNHFGFESPNAVSKYIQLLTQGGYLNVSRTKSGRCREFRSVRRPSRGVPVLGAIAAGNPIEAIENCTETIDVSGIGVDNSNGDFFALTVRGTSMIDAHIMDGDTVVIRRQETVNNGEIAAVLLNNEATLKYVKVLDGGGVALVPANSAMEPIHVEAGAAVSFRVLGRLVSVIRKY